MGRRSLLRPRATPALAALSVVALVLGVAALARAKDDFLPPPPRPDREFYVERIAPWIEANCASCHRGGGGGALRLADETDLLSDTARRRLDFERIAAFVLPRAPWESRLYLKVLAAGDGGDPHVGGSFLSTEDELHDTLLDFLSGATLTNLVPEVWFEQRELRANPKDEVTLDGRGSYDRDRDDMAHLGYWWTLHARPAESRVSIDDRRGSRIVFKPDTGGTYVFTLRVGDGKVWSAPRPLTVEVFSSVAVEQREPGGISDLEHADPQGLARLRRLYLDVLGRSPTPAEAVAEERQGIEALVDNILLRAEMGRAWVEEVSVRLGLYGDYRPESAEAADLALRVPAENLAPHEVERALALDPAFLRRHPPGRSLASAIARLLLEREPTAEETLAAVALADGQSADVPGLGTLDSARAWIVAVVDSDAFRRAAMLRRLARFVDSGAADKRVGHALRAAGEGGKAWRAYLEELLTDKAYLERKQLRPKDTVTFLRGLFIDLLERKPTDRELAALVAAVEAMGADTPAFAAIVRIMIDSGEAPIPLLVDIYDLPRWLKDRFLRYLGRPPTAAELAAYGLAIQHAEGGPELVIQALLTGAEYACR
ncbi:MAG: hypothetical protein O2894_05725 [Planctomycetota bacterium]|nr:hypothetical protein [Planctomycetota bacterium]